MIITLTTEQVEKFVEAVGGSCKPIAGGSFTTEQLHNLAESIGGLRSWPQLTDDPKVNWAIDCILDEEDEQPYDEQMYKEEIEAAKELN